MGGAEAVIGGVVVDVGVGVGLGGCVAASGGGSCGVLAEDGGDFGVVGVLAAGGDGGDVFEIEVFKELGGALRRCLFEVGGVYQHGAAELSDVVSAEGHVLGDIEP